VKLVMLINHKNQSRYIHARIICGNLPTNTDGVSRKDATTRYTLSVAVKLKLARMPQKQKPKMMGIGKSKVLSKQIRAFQM
jgi:hypothetical protein